MLKKFKYWLIPVILLLSGSVSWSLTMIKSGLPGKYGLGFWGPNGHDGIWHIAIAESFIRGSWGMPVFAGEMIRNYHVGYDLLLAIIHKISFIPASNLYFQVMPVATSMGIGIMCFLFVRKWRNSVFEAIGATFFTMFGGSFGWLVNFVRWHNFDGESMFWSQQAISTLVNPPFALSLIVIFSGLYLLLSINDNPDKEIEKAGNNGYITSKLKTIFKRFFPDLKTREIESQKNVKLITAVFLFGILIQIKAYAGILVLAALFTGGIFQMLSSKGIRLLKIFFGSLIISLLIFLPIVDLNKTTFIFKPFWFLETMMTLSDRLNWQKYFQAMTTYRYSDLFVKAAIAYTAAMAMFLVGNFGTRIVGILNFIKKKKPDYDFTYIDVFSKVMIVLGIIIPTFFVQSGTAWNTIQFLYYSLVFSGIYAGIWLGNFLENENSRQKILKYATALAIVIFTIPTSIATLYYHYLPQRPPSNLSLEEYEALKFLAKQPEGVVLTFPFDRQLAKNAENSPPRSLYLYESTAYVSAYSRKPVYLEDEVNLDITGYNWTGRKAEVLDFYSSLDHKYVYDYLRKNNILYVYWVDGQRARLGEGQLGLEEIYRNKRVQVYRVR